MNFTVTADIKKISQHTHCKRLSKTAEAGYKICFELAAQQFPDKCCFVNIIVILFSDFEYKLTLITYLRMENSLPGMD